MAEKSKMKCNSVRSSDRAGKKKMVKACEGGKEKLIHFGAKGYGHNYSAAARKSFGIGPARNFGQVREARLHHLQKTGKENISIFV
jgi:hypothetical protein